MDHEKPHIPSKNYKKKANCVKKIAKKILFKKITKINANFAKKTPQKR